MAYFKKNIQKLKNHLNVSLYKNSYYLMGNSLVNAGIGFFFWILAARLYNPSEIGLGSAIVSAMALLYTLSILGFDIGLIRYLPEEKNKVQMINSVFIITGATALIISLIFIWGIEIWSPSLIILKTNWIYMIIFMTFTIFTSFYFLQTSIFVALRRSKYVLVQSIPNIFKIFILPMLVGLGALGVYFSFGFASVLIFFIANKLIHRSYEPCKLKFQLRIKSIKEMFSYSVKNYVSNVLTNLPTFILPLLIINNVGSTQNAYFFVAWNFCLILLMIPFSISRSLLSEASNIPETLEMNIKKSLNLIFMILIPSILLLVLFGKYILLMFGSEYALNSYNILIILAIATIPYSINQIYSTKKRVQKDIKSIILLYGSIACIVIISSSLFVGTVGIISVGYVWLFTHTFMAILTGFSLYYKKNTY